MSELGYDAVHDEFSMKRVRLSSTGSWPSGEHLPMGGYESGNRTMTWQVETAGSWNWEISDIGGLLYLQISGPSFQENGYLKLLKRGERFVSVPCAVSVVKGGFEESIRELTKYRRAIRRKNSDNNSPSVIFNDYMNCLMGDPSTEKEYPLIDAAAVAGCKYYCIDCGWYSDGEWWDGVGEWLPSARRFPGGIKEPIDYIRKKGMIPGLWLELEVMGIECPLAKQVPSSWFFQRNGRPVIDHSRYQLDFRNSEVIRFADDVIGRLVNDYGVGYIKMDYNINAGVGTD
jgi:alpha-galactosidase